MSANIPTWQERVGADPSKPEQLDAANWTDVSEDMQAEIADLRAALATATAPAVAKKCLMCGGTGHHAIPLAIPAGIEPPPERMVECQQCKSAAPPHCGRCPRDTPYGPAACGKCLEAAPQQVAASERERFEAWCAEKLPVRMIGGLYVNPDTRTALAAWQARAALDRPAVPDGWQIVPKQAPDVIICAIESMVDQQLVASGSSPVDMVRQDGSDIWDAALAAAPAPGDAP